MGRFDKIYAKLPIVLQHAVVSTYGVYWYWLRFGPGYRKYLQDYKERERFTVDEWQIWQKKQLNRILIESFNNVSYYKNSWDKKDLEAALAGHLARLPILDKKILRNDPKAFIRQDMQGWPRFSFYTSGSTGTPLETHWTAKEVRGIYCIPRGAFFRLGWCFIHNAQGNIFRATD